MYYYKIIITNVIAISLRPFSSIVRYRTEHTTFSVRKVVETGLCVVYLFTVRWRYSLHLVKRFKTITLAEMIVTYWFQETF